MTNSHKSKRDKKAQNKQPRDDKHPFFNPKKEDKPSNKPSSTVFFKEDSLEALHNGADNRALSHKMK